MTTILNDDIGSLLDKRINDLLICNLLDESDINTVMTIKTDRIKNNDIKISTLTVN